MRLLLSYRGPDFKKSGHLKFVLYQKMLGTLCNTTGFKYHKCILSQFIQGRKCVAKLDWKVPYVYHYIF